MYTDDFVGKIEKVRRVVVEKGEPGASGPLTGISKVRVRVRVTVLPSFEVDF